MSRKKSKKENFLSKSEYETLSDFRYAVRQFIQFSKDAAESVGLTPHQHQALLAIKGFPNRDKITNGELAERLRIKHHSAVGLVNRLEAQNLVVREQSDADRREVYLTLSRRGEELLERLTAVHQEELQNLAPQLTGILESLKR
ncbi:MAG: MarR family winged helix-turn-helix transcriptional regulator [Pyrinomonadaceae bacterium]